jgi:hypothetical protein
MEELIKMAIREKKLVFTTRTSLEVGSETNTYQTLDGYLKGKSIRPLFISGDALEVLKMFPSESIDFCMTSPPYWGHRQYERDGIGLDVVSTDMLQKSFIYNIHLYLKLQSSQDIGLCGGEKLYI